MSIKNMSRYTRISGNCLYFSNLTSYNVVPETILSLKRLIYKFGHKDIVLNFEKAGYAYAYPITAIVGIINYFKINLGINFSIKSSDIFFEKMGIIDQYSFDQEEANCLGKIWLYNNSNEANLITLKIMKTIRRLMVCEEGVLDTCEWALYEIMDNVIQHSEISKGFVMGGIDKKNKILNICVFDYGVGILNSLSKSALYNPKSEVDAISLAIKEGVTSGNGQGYGLAGLNKIISQNGGKLTIISGKGGLVYKGSSSEVLSFSHMLTLGKDLPPTTTVNFYLKLNRDVSIENTVGKHYTNMYLENFENNQGEIVFTIKDQALGTATRQEAENVRNEMINIYKTTRRVVVIDFSGIAIISSSFADELIAKIMYKIGYIQFQKIFRIQHESVPIRCIIDKAIEKRMRQN